MIRVRTLGPLDLRRSDGTEVHSVLAQPKRTALLVHLAASQAGFCQRDTLLGRFWPDSTMERARHSLNQALYALRRSLGEGVIGAVVTTRCRSTAPCSGVMHSSSSSLWPMTV